ncbi:MAG: hypothetical protein U0Y82_08725 [Thermoleophilia bacterium]
MSGARLVDVAPWCVGWVAPTPEYMHRTSHAVLAGGGVWYLDPVDDAAALEAAARLGPPAGVVQMLDRHGRDCAALAQRLGVPLHVLPSTAPAGAPFEVLPVVDAPRLRWREVALWFPEHRALAVAEAVGTAPYFTAPGATVGPHPVLRLVAPPRVLLGRSAEHLLVGHGPGLHGPDTGREMDAQISGARRAIPAWSVALSLMALGRLGGQAAG